MGSPPGASLATRTRRADTLASRVRRVVEVCNGGHLAALDTLLPPSRPAEAAAPGAATGPAGSAGPTLREYLAAFRAAVPDARGSIVEHIPARAVRPVGRRPAVDPSADRQA